MSTGVLFLELKSRQSEQNTGEALTCSVCSFPWCKVPTVANFESVDKSKPSENDQEG